MQLFVAASIKRVGEIHLTHPISMRTTEVKFVLTTMFHPNSPRELVFVRVALPRFLFCIVIVMIMKMAVSSYEYSGIDICLYRNLSDLEYTTDVVLLSADPSKLQVLFDSLNGSVSIFGVRFAPSKCKTPLQD